MAGASDVIFIAAKNHFCTREILCNCKSATPSHRQSFLIIMKKFMSQENIHNETICIDRNGFEGRLIGESHNFVKQVYWTPLIALVTSNSAAALLLWKLTQPFGSSPY